MKYKTSFIFSFKFKFYKQFKLWKTKKKDLHLHQQTLWQNSDFFMKRKRNKVLLNKSITFSLVEKNDDSKKQHGKEFRFLDK